MVRAPAKKHDVGHIRGRAEGCFDEQEGETMQRKERGEKEAGKRRGDRSPPAVVENLEGLAVLALQQVKHCTDGVRTSREEERDHVHGRKGSGFLSLDAPPLDRNTQSCRATSSSTAAHLSRRHLHCDNQTGGKRRSDTFTFFSLNVILH